MRKVDIKTGTLSAAATLHAQRRRANDNVVDVPLAAGAEILGAYTPVIFDDFGAPDTTVVHASPDPITPTIVRAERMMPDSDRLVSNADHPGFEGAQPASSPGWVAGLWHALRREWMIARAASKLESMSDLQLSDIGVQRGDIDFIVRHGRDAPSRQPCS